MQNSLAATSVEKAVDLHLAQTLSKSLNPHHFIQLFKMTNECKNETIKIKLKEYIDNWLQLAFDSISEKKIPINIFEYILPIPFLLEQEFIYSNQLASEINHRIQNVLTGYSDANNWYAKFNLAFFFAEKLNLQKKKQSKADNDAQFSKFITLLSEVIETQTQHASHRAVFNYIVSEFYYLSEKATTSKNRQQAFAAYIKHENRHYLKFRLRPSAYKQDEEMAAAFACGNYMPAIFHLAETHAQHQNLFSQTSPHYRRAISLYLKGMTMIAGLTSKEAATLFLCDEKQIEYWKETGLKFIKDVANNVKNPYQKYAEWAYVFLNMLELKSNIFNDDISPNSFILIALNNWETIISQHPELEAIKINPNTIKETYLKGLEEALEFNTDHSYSEKYFTGNIAPSRVINILNSPNPSLNLPTVEDQKTTHFDKKTTPTLFKDKDVSAAKKNEDEYNKIMKCFLEIDNLKKEKEKPKKLALA